MPSLPVFVLVNGRTLSATLVTDHEVPDSFVVMRRVASALTLSPPVRSEDKGVQTTGVKRRNMFNYELRNEAKKLVRDLLAHEYGCMQWFANNFKILARRLDDETYCDLNEFALDARRRFKHGMTVESLKNEALVLSQMFEERISVLRHTFIRSAKKQRKVSPLAAQGPSTSVDTRCT